MCLPAEASLTCKDFVALATLCACVLSSFGRCTVIRVAAIEPQSHVAVDCKQRLVARARLPMCPPDRTPHEHIILDTVSDRLDTAHGRKHSVATPAAGLVSQPSRCKHVPLRPVIARTQKPLMRVYVPSEDVCSGVTRLGDED